MLKPTYLDLLAAHGIDGAHPGGLELTKKVLEREQIRENVSLLDVGCGTGQTSAFIAKQFRCEVTAVDNHPVMLESAAKRFLNENLHINLINADAMKLPFPENSFDIILAESVTIFTEIPRTLSEYFRVLKRSGVLIDIEMTSEQPFTAKELNDARGFYGIERLPSQNEWSRLFYRAGFSEIRVTCEKNTGFIDSIPPSLSLNPFMRFCLMNSFFSKLGCRVFRCTI